MQNGLDGQLCHALLYSRRMHGCHDCMQDPHEGYEGHAIQDTCGAAGDHPAGPPPQQPTAASMKSEDRYKRRIVAAAEEAEVPQIRRQALSVSAAPSKGAEQGAAAVPSRLASPPPPPAASPPAAPSQPQLDSTAPVVAAALPAHHLNKLPATQPSSAAALPVQQAAPSRPTIKIRSTQVQQQRSPTQHTTSPRPSSPPARPGSPGPASQPHSPRPAGRQRKLRIRMPSRLSTTQGFNAASAACPGTAAAAQQPQQAGIEPPLPLLPAPHRLEGGAQPAAAGRVPSGQRMRRSGSCDSMGSSGPPLPAVGAAPGAATAGGLPAAVQQARIHAALQPDRAPVEPGAVPTVAALQQPYTVTQVQLPYTAMQVPQSCAANQVLQPAQLPQHLEQIRLHLLRQVDGSDSEAPAAEQLQQIQGRPVTASLLLPEQPAAARAACCCICNAA